MNKVYDRITNIRGNLITVNAEKISLGEIAKIHNSSGKSVLASVLSIDREQITLQTFESTRGISTGDRVTFLGKQVQAITGDALLGRRFNGIGDPIDDGPKAEAFCSTIPEFLPPDYSVDHKGQRQAA